MSEIIKSQQRIFAREGFPCKPTGLWDAASQAAMQGFSRTPAAAPMQPRHRPLHQSDVLPATWRIVGTGLDARFERAGDSSTSGTVAAAKLTPPAPLPADVLELTADVLQDFAPEPEPAAPAAVEQEPAPAVEAAAPVAPAAPAAPAEKGNQAKAGVPFKKIK